MSFINVKVGIFVDCLKFSEILFENYGFNIIGNFYCLIILINVLLYMKKIFFNGLLFDEIIVVFCFDIMVNNVIVIVL